MSRLYHRTHVPSCGWFMLTSADIFSLFVRLLHGFLWAFWCICGGTFSASDREKRGLLWWRLLPSCLFPSCCIFPFVAWWRHGHGGSTGAQDRWDRQNRRQPCHPMVWHGDMVQACLPTALFPPFCLHANTELQCVTPYCTHACTHLW